MKHQKFLPAIHMLTIFFMSVYLLWRLFFTLPFHNGPLAFVMGVMLLYAEIIAALGTFELIWRKNKKFHLAMPEIEDHEFPEVDVLIATHNEPVDLLFLTANACTFMEYPDKSKVHIYLCDDGNRPAVAELAKSLEIGYIPLTGNKHAKSGNLNHALSMTKSPLVVTFDADMIPRRKFLLKSIPYFFLTYKKQLEDGSWINRLPEEIDETFRIGFIQTPQSFYNPDLFQYNLYAEQNIPNEQDFFTKEINVSRNSSNAPAYTGSNTVIARLALMDIGGFPTDTITEDFETGILIQSHGYTTYATTEVLASGLSPTTFKSMLSQRVRWARGVIQSIRNCRVPFNQNLSVAARISYMVNYSYWGSFGRRIIFTMAPIVFALFDLQIAVCGFWDLLLFWGPSHLFYSISMRLLSSDVRNQRWSQIIDTILAPYMVIPVLLENLGIKQRKFKVTRKNKEERGNEFSFHYALPHIIQLALSIAALVRFTSGKYGMALIYSSIIIFWLVYNVINLVYAIIFIWGRKIYRQSERFAAKEDLTIITADHVYQTKTVNISESGLAFTMSKPNYVPNEIPFQLCIQTDFYYAKLKGILVYVKQVKQNWYYGVRITEIDEENLRQYAQIVYDRMHSLPTVMNHWVTAADELSKNLSVRMEKQRFEQRKLPRILLEMPIVMADGSTGTILDFNYRYMMIRDLRSKRQDQTRYILHCAYGIQLELEVVTAKNASRTLLAITNWKDLVYKEELGQLVDEWLTLYQREE